MIEFIFFKIVVPVAAAVICRHHQQQGRMERQRSRYN